MGLLSLAATCALADPVGKWELTFPATFFRSRTAITIEPITFQFTVAKDESDFIVSSLSLGQLRAEHFVAFDVPVPLLHQATALVQDALDHWIIEDGPSLVSSASFQWESQRFFDIRYVSAAAAVSCLTYSHFQGLDFHLKGESISRIVMDLTSSDFGPVGFEIGMIESRVEAFLKTRDKIAQEHPVIVNPEGRFAIGRLLLSNNREFHILNDTESLHSTHPSQIFLTGCAYAIAAAVTGATIYWLVH